MNLKALFRAKPMIWASVGWLTVASMGGTSRAQGPANENTLGNDPLTYQTTVGTVQNPSPAYTTGSTPGLYGNVSDLRLRTSGSGTGRIKALLQLSNTSTQAFHHVTATVFLSDDATLSADDMQLTSFKFSDYLSKGKVQPLVALSLPISQKIPSVVLDYLRTRLNGKYLIVTLSGPDLDASQTQPIVVGPIQL